MIHTTEQRKCLQELDFFIKKKKIQKSICLMIQIKIKKKKIL